MYQSVLHATRQTSSGVLPVHHAVHSCRGLCPEGACIFVTRASPAGTDDDLTTAPAVQGVVTAPAVQGAAAIVAWLPHTVDANEPEPIPYSGFTVVVERGLPAGLLDGRAEAGVPDKAAIDCPANGTVGRLLAGMAGNVLTKGFVATACLLPSLVGVGSLC
mmetsp:Transcript_41467/g.74417  ORF Transcript_41467/g.74417 Transcript_41467/m.74417 type:complete len:161 (+) Transcript_41467:146-628(+)